jgi:hypothetical protein
MIKNHTPPDKMRHPRGLLDRSGEAGPGPSDPEIPETAKHPPQSR